MSKQTKKHINLPVLNKVDEKKVIDAYNKLRTIFIKNFQKAMDNAMLEAGKYLIDVFYEGQYDKAEEKKSTHANSLRQLFFKFQQQTDGNSPGKTWLYNSIDIAIAHNKYNKISSYGNLTHSHKIKLVHSKFSDDRQKQLIEETASKKYSVKALQERITELKNNNKKDYVKLESVLKLLQRISKKTFSGSNDQELQTLQNELQKQIDNINKVFNDKIEEII
jgi:hypothetical protein